MLLTKHQTLTGPSLLALSRQTGAALSHIGFIFTVRAVMYLLGTFGGLLFERFDPHRLLGAALLIALVGTLCVPLTTDIYALAATMGCQGLVMGFLDTGVNTLIFIVHAGKRVEPYMQALHFSFGLGAFISPIIVGAVLEAYAGTVKVAFVALGLVGAPFLLLLLHFPSPGRPDSCAFYEVDEVLPPTRKDGVESVDDASAAGAVASVAAAAPTSLFALARRDQVVVALVASILFAAVGIEVASGSFIPTFAVKTPAIAFDEFGGSTLVATYWGAFTAARFAAIFLSIRFTPPQLLGACIAGLAAAVLVCAACNPLILSFMVVAFTRICIVSWCTRSCSLMAPRRRVHCGSRFRYWASRSARCFPRP